MRKQYLLFYFFLLKSFVIFKVQDEARQNLREIDGFSNGWESFDERYKKLVCSCERKRLCPHLVLDQACTEVAGCYGTLFHSKSSFFQVLQLCFYFGFFLGFRVKVQSFSILRRITSIFYSFKKHTKKNDKVFFSSLKSTLKRVK